MKRLMLIVAVAIGAVSLGACGGGEVAVLAQLEDAPGAAEGSLVLSDLPVTLLPYDRDVIFDSLAAAFREPEPEVPDSLLALQDSIVAARMAWQQAEGEWLEVRDSLRTLSQALDGLSRSDPEYILLFRDFQELRSRVNALQARSEQAFQRFAELQERFRVAAREIRLLQQQWAAEAFAPVDSVIAARLEQLDREIHIDTTDATGTVPFEVPTGQWWVYARREIPVGELYWNEPIEVTGDQPVEVLLNRENAEVRRGL